MEKQNAITKRNPEWMTWIAPERFNDAELFRIVIFFVFHSPCSKISYMGKSLKEYGWNSPWEKPYYLNRQLLQAASNYNLIYAAKTYNEMYMKLTEAKMLDTFPLDHSQEKICIYNNCKNYFLSVFII